MNRKPDERGATAPRRPSEQTSTTASEEVIDLRTGAEPAASTTDAGSTPADLALRALVVDDDPAVRALLRRILLGRRFIVLEAGSGQAALDLLFQSVEIPSIVLLDRSMPTMSGTDVAAAIRGNPRFDAMPIIVISGLPEGGTEETDPAVRVDAFLDKPFNPAVVLDTIEHLLGLSTPDDEGDPGQTPVL